MSDVRTWLVEAQERANLCRCQGDHDQRSLDALVAVLDLLDECESFYGSVLFDGTPMPTIVGTDEVRRAITKHLPTS